MKRLVLLRHAKSDWHADAPSDHARPLNKRGNNAARRMGVAIAAAGEVPGKVISSSAVRARTTAELAAAAGSWESQIEVTDAVYGVSPGNALRVVHAQPEDIASLMLVGHEPTWSQLASVLSGGGRVRVATATAVAIDFEVTRWENVAAGRGQIAWVLNPRLFEHWDGIA